MSNNAFGTMHKLAVHFSLIFCFAVFAPVLVQAQSSASNTGIDEDHVQMLDQYCIECHNLYFLNFQ